MCLLPSLSINFFLRAVLNFLLIVHYFDSYIFLFFPSHKFMTKCGVSFLIPVS